jgi:hypothetical protein
MLSKTQYVEANNISRDIKNVLNPRQDHRNSSTIKVLPSS